MDFFFEKLAVYQQAVEFAGIANKLSGDFPRGSYSLADQLRRASLSIPANIAEGSGRFHKADKRNFYIIARGSAYECVPLLKVAHDCRAIDETMHLDLRDRLMALVKMLTRLEQSVHINKDKN